MKRIKSLLTKQAIANSHKEQSGIIKVLSTARLTLIPSRHLSIISNRNNKSRCSRNDPPSNDSDSLCPISYCNTWRWSIMIQRNRRRKLSCSYRCDFYDAATFSNSQMASHFSLIVTHPCVSFICPVIFQMLHTLTHVHRLTKRVIINYHSWHSMTALLSPFRLMFILCCRSTGIGR